MGDPLGLLGVRVGARALLSNGQFQRLKQYCGEYHACPLVPLFDLQLFALQLKDLRENLGIRDDLRFKHRAYCTLRPAKATGISWCGPRHRLRCHV